MTSSPPRASSESVSSSDDRRPSIGQHSNSALIIVHDDDDDDDANSFSFSNDEEDGTHSADNILSEVVLPPSVAFGYFLAPCLKLGAMLILSSQTALRTSVPALLVFSLLSAFSRQIWFLLARYVRKSDVGDIVAEGLVRGYGRDGVRALIKSATRLGSGAVRLLLATVYLKGAINSLRPLVPDEIPFVSTSVLLSVVFMVFISPLCLGRSLASKRMVYSTGLSNVLYILWLCAIIYAHAKGSLDTDTIMIAQGRLFQDITAIAFAFSSLSTLHLYAGMIGIHISGDKKEKRYLSISSVSLAAGLLGTVLVLPLIFPQVKTHNHDQPTEDASLVQGLITTLIAFILILAIPPLITSSPPLPVPLAIRRITVRPLGRHALLVLLFLLSLLPQAAEPLLEDAALLLVLLSTYVLPALLHIVLHNLRRPLAILGSPQQIRRAASDADADHYHSGGASGHDRDTEELLLRKERALQRRRFGRRILWDIGVWVLLVPVGGGGIVWAVGRLARVW